MSDKMFHKIRFNFNAHLEEFVDFVFHVNGQSFKVHRVTLAAQSEVFYKIFKTNEKEFTVNDVSADIFKEIIKFIYTGQLDIGEADENELIRAATKFEIKALMGQIQLRRNLRHSPLAVKELDNLKNKFDEASYLYEKSKERLSIRNPFHDPPSRYY